MEEYSITCVKFSPNSKYLAVGCQSGALKLYEVKIKNSKEGEPNSLKLVLSQSFETVKSAVLGISFSSCSTYFAVSYMAEQI
jgi:WD40 repeat protein